MYAMILTQALLKIGKTRISPVHWLKGPHPEWQELPSPESIRKMIRNLCLEYIEDNNQYCKGQDWKYSNVESNRPSQ